MRDDLKDEEADYSTRLCRALRAGHQYTGIVDAYDEAAANHIETLVVALRRSMVAIDDWLNVYASDLCDPARIEEAKKRISEHGTLSYIAMVQDQNRKALGK